jgi:hypothetical protein
VVVEFVRALAFLFKIVGASEWFHFFGLAVSGRRRRSSIAYFSGDVKAFQSRFMPDREKWLVDLVLWL